MLPVRLAIFSAGHLKVRAVEPGAHERLVGGGLRLRDLVLVVREDEVDAAGVQVEARPEVAHAHGRALDVPARPTLAEARRPAGLSRLGAFPDREVAHVVLVVLIALDAFADPLVGRVEPRQPAVARPARDPEEDRAVIGPIRMASLEKGLDERDHGLDVLGRPGQHVRCHDAQASEVVEEGDLVA